jgi:hypothetical protein
MAYKTQFRDVKYPESIDELAALGEDANSLRSLGAALYNHLAGIQSEDNTHNALRVVLGVTKQTSHLIEPSKKAKLIYFVQGAGIAAKKARNPEQVEYLSGLLQNLGYEGKQSGRTKKIREILTSMAPPDEKRLQALFGVGEKYQHVIEDIGKDFEATSKRIRQVEARALKKLKTIKE